MSSSYFSSSCSLFPSICFFMSALDIAVLESSESCVANLIPEVMYVNSVWSHSLWEVIRRDLESGTP